MGADIITLRYFVPGHTSADAFHRKLENLLKEMGKVCDLDFVRCVQRAGDDVIMEVESMKLA